MITTPENFASANKAAVETFLTLANTALAGTERVAALNLNVARSFLEDGVANAKALFGVRDPQHFVALQNTLAQPALEKFVSYSRNLYEIATETKEEVSKLVETQVANLNKNVADALDKAAKNAPAGSDGAIAAVRSAIAATNSAYDNISKAANQVAEIAGANISAATNATAKAAGTSAKAKKAA